MSDNYAAEKDFTSFKGERDGMTAIGYYDASYNSLKTKSQQTSFLELTIHIEDPAMELPDGDNGLPDEDQKTMAQACKNRILSAMRKHGPVLYTGYYYWFNQMIVYTYLQDKDVNAMFNELNKIMDDQSKDCNLAVSLRNDADWEGMKFFDE